MYPNARDPANIPAWVAATDVEESHKFSHTISHCKRNEDSVPKYCIFLTSSVKIFFKVYQITRKKIIYHIINESE